MVNTLAVQTDGDLYVGGGFTNFQGNNGVNYFVRLNTNGSLDTDFVTTNAIDSSADVYSISLNSDGTMYIGGSFISYFGNARRFARVTATGARDPSLNTTVGFDTTVWTTYPTSDGSGCHWAGGDFLSYTSMLATYLAKICPYGSIE